MHNTHTLWHSMIGSHIILKHNYAAVRELKSLRSKHARTTRIFHWSSILTECKACEFLLWL